MDEVKCIVLNEELFEQQMREQIERAEAGAEVARARALDGNERVRATHVAEESERGVDAGSGATNASELLRRDQRERRHSRRR